MLIRGVIPPLTTPFEGGRISTDRLHDNIERYNRHDLGGYVILGSTGEAALVDIAEREGLYKAARGAVPNDKVLIAGTGMESTQATIDVCRLAADCGADACLVITPHFFRTLMSDDVLIRHFSTVADESPTAIILYNVPQMTGVQISTGAVKKLSEHENIAGIKDSSGSLAYMMDLLANVPGDFAVVCGNMSLFAAAVSAGACGGVLAIADALPEPYVKIYGLVQEQRITEAMVLQKGVVNASKTLFADHGVPGLKAAMDARGLFGGEPRLPVLRAGEGARQAIRTQLDTLLQIKLIEDLEL